jgi:hypothetical protein
MLTPQHLSIINPKTAHSFKNELRSLYSDMKDENKLDDIAFLAKYAGEKPDYFKTKYIYLLDGNQITQFIISYRDQYPDKLIRDSIRFVNLTVLIDPSEYLGEKEMFGAVLHTILQKMENARR